jgi:hypothetical protein
MYATGNGQESTEPADFDRFEYRATKTNNLDYEPSNCLQNFIGQNSSAGFRQPFDFCQPPPPYGDNRFGR